MGLFLSSSSMLSTSSESTSTTLTKISVLQDVMDNIFNIKDKLSDKEYKEIVESVGRLSKDRFQLIDNKQSIIMKHHGNLSFHENDVETLINYACKNWDLVTLIEIDFTRRQENNFINLLLDRVVTSHLYGRSFIDTTNQRKFLEKYKQCLTFENVQFTQENLQGDVSENNISDILQALSQRFDRYKGDLQISYKKIGPLIFSKIPSSFNNVTIHRYWYDVARRVLEIEPSMYCLPRVMWDDYEIVSSICFHEDFYFPSERLKNDESLLIDLFKKNVLFYKYLNEANRRKHMYDIVDPRIDLRCVKEILTISTNDLLECVVKFLPEESFEDKLFIIRFISKFENGFIIMKFCSETLKER